MSPRIVHSRPAPRSGAPTLCAEPGPLAEPGGEITCGDCLALSSNPLALAMHLDALHTVKFGFAPLLLTEPLVADFAREAAEVLSVGAPRHLAALVSTELEAIEQTFAPGDDSVGRLDYVASVSLRGALLLLHGVRAARERAWALREEAAPAAPTGGPS